MKINEMMRADEKGLRIKSIDLVDVINRFRKLEDGKVELLHKSFMTKIRKELETLELLGLEGEQNFSLTYYNDSQGKSRPCYELSRDGMLQMLNSESTLVRYKTVEYINTLEEENKQLNAAELINALSRQVV